MAAAGLPDGAGHAAVDFFDEGLLNFRADLQDALLTALYQPQAIHGVADLGFDHEDDGIVTKAGVGAQKDEEIGEAVDGDAEIGRHAFPPRIVNFHAALPYHAATDQRLGGAKTGAINQDIDRTLDAVTRDDAVRAHLGDSFRDQLDVRTIECWIVVVGNEDAFAAQLIVGRERRANLLIFDVPGEMAARNGLDHLTESLIAEKAEDTEFLTPEKQLAQGPAGDGDGTEAAPPFFTDGKIEARDDPRRRALKKRKLADVRRDLRDELDGACPGA